VKNPIIHIIVGISEARDDWYKNLCVGKIERAIPTPAKVAATEFSQPAANKND
jgi:hypothetical protein